MITLSNWREKMSEDMRLRDFRARTQEAYLLAVRQFLDKVKSEPETLTDEDVRRYFLFLREERKMAPSTINIAVHGLRFSIATGPSSICCASTTHENCPSCSVAMK